jgi:general secretion pathway protein A
MLSNITDAGKSPMQTILMGQPQLRRMLAHPDLEQLRQRVVACHHLHGLSRQETHAYVVHRLRAAGSRGRPEWTPEALDMVHQHSDGVPRRINRLCARVLLGGALDQLNRLTAEFVEATALELEEDLGGPMAARPAPAETTDELQRRIRALEENARRRERIISKIERLAALLPDSDEAKP